MKSIHLLRFLAVLAAVLAATALACRSDVPLEGVYQARAQVHGQDLQLSIELNENGVGVWKAGADEVSFRWQVNGQVLQLATKAGGIIIGKIHGKTLDVELPGRGTISFTKAD